MLLATKSSNELPASGDDFDYYSSFPAFQDVMNIEGKRILHMYVHVTMVVSIYMYVTVFNLF